MPNFLFVTMPWFAGLKVLLRLVETLSTVLFFIYLFILDRGNDAVRRSRSRTRLSISRPIGSFVPVAASAQINGRLLGAETHAEVESYCHLHHEADERSCIRVAPGFPCQTITTTLIDMLPQGGPNVGSPNTCSTNTQPCVQSPRRWLQKHCEQIHTPKRSTGLVHGVHPFPRCSVQNLTGDGSLRLLILPIVHLHILEVLSALIIA